MLGTANAVVFFLLGPLAEQGVLIPEPGLSNSPQPPQETRCSQVRARISHSARALCEPMGPGKGHCLPSRDGQARSTF